MTDELATLIKTWFVIICKNISAYTYFRKQGTRLAKFNDFIKISNNVKFGEFSEEIKQQSRWCILEIECILDLFLSDQQSKAIDYQS